MVQYTLDSDDFKGKVRMHQKEAHLSNVFTGKISKHELNLKDEERRYRNIGYIKLVLVIMLGIALYYGIINQFEVPFGVVSIVIFLILVLFWIYHIKIKEKIVFIKGMITLNRTQIHRIEGRWTDFEDSGLEFVDTGHNYGCDLDIVGRNSLFQFLNTTQTWHGRQAFSRDLLEANYTINQLYHRQKAVEELSGKIDFSNKIQYYLGKIGLDPSTPAFINSLKDNTPFLKNKIVKIFLKALPLITLFSITVNFIFPNAVFLYLAALFGGVQIIAWIIGFLKTPGYLNIMASLPYKLRAYTDIINHLMVEEFSSEELVGISNELKVAEDSIKDLGKIASRISIRHNLLIYFVLNLSLLWDYQSAFALEKWKEKYSNTSENWFLAIGKFESLLSFSHLPNVCEGTSLPTFEEKDRIILGKELGHPLLLNDTRVCNDFNFQDNVYIISGSNMSGKTTFLRTVGINLVLARAGGFVCAKKMECYPLDVITSMRIGDDLSEGVSTFYAELRRIKKIIDSVKNQSNMLFLIDEIFRGTNSKDRMLGAKTVIKKLYEVQGVGLISTHDLELCELENDDGVKLQEQSQLVDRKSQDHNTVSIKNAHFSEYYEDGEIHFDYKLKTGISDTSNARFLMEMVGIQIDEKP